MKILNSTKVPAFKPVLAVMAAVGIGSGAAPMGALANEAGETYDWSAELVSFDETNNTATVKARVEEYSNIEGLDEYSEGDRLTLVWTGRSWAAGIRDIGRDPETHENALTLPVEFVGAESDGRYLSFRVPVPADSAARVSELMPGDRVTGISPRSATDWTMGVVSLRHYNDVS